MADERRRRPMGAFETAEAVFKPTTPVAAAAPSKAAPAIPGARELVQIRIDQDVLAHFQADGAGWQDRLNATLRKAIGF